VEFLQMPFETWKKTLAVNLDGAMLCSQLTARRMVESRIEGSIICVTSVNGFQVEKNRLAYNVSKGGLEILVKSMAAELGPHGIRVNGISPGLVKTDMVPADFWDGDWSLFRAKTPLGRHGVVEDIAGPAVFLASDQSGYVNGHIIVVDGGMTITQI
jgi:NAD(P)-dependent dehydrogenase (short-subunit alcohol dehydrogenase family)